MIKFTTEEIMLICVYDLDDRTELIEELTDSLRYVFCPDEKKVMRSVIEKLKQITDGEYAGMGIFPEIISIEQEA
jgi:hypothetical protein